MQILLHLDTHISRIHKFLYVSLENITNSFCSATLVIIQMNLTHVNWTSLQKISLKDQFISTLVCESVYVCVHMWNFYLWPPPKTMKDIIKYRKINIGAKIAYNSILLLNHSNLLLSLLLLTKGDTLLIWQILFGFVSHMKRL